VQVRRVYDPPKSDDGRRVLVDRLWPRGLSKERARLDDRYKEIAPFTERVGVRSPRPGHQPTPRPGCLAGLLPEPLSDVLGREAERRGAGC